MYLRSASRSASRPIRSAFSFCFSPSVWFALIATPLRLRVMSPSATTASLRWDHCPHASCPHSSSHPSPFHWTTTPSRGPALAAADADKNLCDVARLLAQGDAKALEQFYPRTAPH